MHQNPHSASTPRILLLGSGPETDAACRDFLAQHPGALVLVEHTHANISGYASTVADEISLILEPLCLQAAQLKQEVQRVAQELGIGDLLEADPFTLSGGQTQLVALASLFVLAQALGGAAEGSGEVPALLLHSPLHGLDRDKREKVLALMDFWPAALLWTQPGEPHPRERELASTIEDHRQPLPQLLSLDLPWQLTPGRLEVKKLAISPLNRQRGRLGTFLARRRPQPSALQENLTFTLEAGSLLLVRGSNGVGKTTLLKTLAGLLAPLTGSVQVSGQEVHLLSPQKRVRAVSMAGQHASHRIIGSTLAQDLGLGPAGGATDELYRGLCQLLAVDTWGDEETLGEQAHPHDLTASQQHLLSILNALLVSPSLLILDEPTAHLTPADTARLLALLDSYRRAGGSLIVTGHDSQLSRLGSGKILHLEA